MRAALDGPPRGLGDGHELATQDGHEIHAPARASRPARPHVGSLAPVHGRPDLASGEQSPGRLALAVVRAAVLASRQPFRDEGREHPCDQRGKIILRRETMP